MTAYILCCQIWHNEVYIEPHRNDTSWKETAKLTRSHSAYIKKITTILSVWMQDTSSMFIKGWGQSRVKVRMAVFSIIRTGVSEVISHTWSVHQYQIEAGVWPRRKAGQGRSEVTASRIITQASSRGWPQVLLECAAVAFGMAIM